MITNRVARTLTLAGITAALIVAAPGVAFAAPGDPDVVEGPNLSKGARDAPGGAAIQDLINYIGFYTLMFALAGFLLSLLILAIGPRIGFERAGLIGRIGLITTLLVAFGVGVAAVLINFFYNMGS